MKNWLFYLGFATLITHELDAMTQSEWRLLFILRGLPEQIASDAFVLIHIPLIAVLLWIINHEAAPLRYGSRIAVTAFLIIHAGLHKALEHHPQYTFHSTLSQALIYGGGMLGFLYLITVFISWRQSAFSNSVRADEC